MAAQSLQPVSQQPSYAPVAYYKGAAAQQCSGRFPYKQLQRPLGGGRGVHYTQLFPGEIVRKAYAIFLCALRGVIIHPPGAYGHAPGQGGEDLIQTYLPGGKQGAQVALTA